MFNLKLRDFSTIIIVNKDHQTKSLRVNTKHVQRFKYYVAAVIVAIAGLTAGIVYLCKQNNQQEQERTALLAQIAHLKGEKPTVVESPNSVDARGYIQQIESKLKTINDYLKRRGIQGFSVSHTGGSGATDDKKLSDKEVFSLYNESLTKLVSTVAFTPMGYPRISSFTSFFGYRSDPFNTEHAEFHPGIDFKGERGDAVKCTANGKIVFAGWYGGYGNCVRIQHIGNLETLYGHLSKIYVKVGQKVSAGDVVGAVGSTGHSTGTHLHYEVRKNGKPVNPVKYLSLNK